MHNSLLPIGTRVSIRSRGYLPHWEVDDACYFITYRLADSLPRFVIQKLRAEYAAAKRMLLAGRRKMSFAERSRVSEWFHRRLDEHLDEGRGACHLRVPAIKGEDLASVLHSWKSYTANEANAISETHGKFWWREYYDHCIRDEEELARSIRYVIENPVKAGLGEWPYIWCAGS